jgi:hypothetical protein
VKCLSIRHPWAEAVLAGLKEEEYRSRPTNHRGPVLIHAGRTIPPAEDVADARETWPDIDLSALVFGAVLGVVDLVDCQPDPDEEGTYVWVLANPRRLSRPLPWTGQVGLFNVPDEQLAGLL